MNIYWLQVDAIKSILQVKKLRGGEVGPTATRWPRQDLNPGDLAPESSP